MRAAAIETSPSAAWPLRDADPIDVTEDAWGNIEQGAEVGGHSFTGREWDPETGLYFFRARYLDPKLGRFISEDPIGFAAGANLYAYVHNDPVTGADPTGLWSAAAHNLMLQWAFGGRVRQSAVDVMKRASRDFDRHTQGASDSYKHFMHSDDCTEDDAWMAKIKAEVFIEKRVAAAQVLAKAGKNDDALVALAEALHTVQDSFSPLHVDENGPPRQWVWWFPFGHSPNEAIGSESAEALIGASVLDRQAARSMELFMNVFPGGLR